MQWLELAAAASSACLVFAIVGIPLSRLMGLRGYVSVAAAPAFAATIIALTAVVAPWLGVTWSLLAVIVGGAVVGVSLWAVRRATAGSAPAPAPRRRFDGWLLGGLLAAAALLTLRFVEIIYDPGNISQTFDNVFHLNGVRFVLDTGNASSLWLGRMSNPSGGLPFYPAAWHALVALVVQITGTSIPVAVNGVALAVSAVVWPLGVVLLTRTLFGRKPVLTVSAALLAASLPIFPTLLMDYGVLYPYQLGLAVLPVALVATLRTLGLAGSNGAPRRWWWAIALIGAIPGVALSHPGAFVSWMALTFPMALVFIVQRWREARPGRERRVIAAWSIAYLCAGAALAIVLRPPSEARGWPIGMNMAEALFDLISVSVWYQVPAVLAATAVLAGVVWACVARTPPALVSLGMYVVAGLLFIVVASLPLLYVRDALTGMWYNNLPRLAALLPVAMVPIGAYGVACSWARISSLRPVRRIVARAPRWALSALGVIAACAATLSLQTGSGSPVPMAMQWASSTFYLGANSPLLTADEMTLLKRVAKTVPEGVAIAGSPYTGTSLAYAVADRPVLMPHVLMETTDDLKTINDGLADAEAGDEVCAALERRGVGYVLDFGDVRITDFATDFPGLDGLEHSDAVRLVDRQGDARLYEIVSCANTVPSR